MNSFTTSISDEFYNNGGDYALQGQTQFQARGGMTPQRPMMNKGMYQGYIPQQQQQNSPYIQQQQQNQQQGMNPQLRGMMPRYPNPPGVKRPASSMFGQNMMSNGPPMPQQQQQQNIPGNFSPFPAQVKQEPNFPPQYPVSSFNIGFMICLANNHSQWWKSVVVILLKRYSLLVK